MSHVIESHVAAQCELSPCLPMSSSLCLAFLQLFAIVVFATITAEGYVNTATEVKLECMFNANDSACSYGVGIGVLAFLACVVFLVLDAYFPQISNAKERKAIVLGDLVFSGESLVLLETLYENKREVL